MVLCICMNQIAHHRYGIITGNLTTAGLTNTMMPAGMPRRLVRERAGGRGVMG